MMIFKCFLMLLRKVKVMTIPHYQISREDSLRDCLLSGLDVIRIKSIQDGKGFLNDVLAFVTAFQINANPLRDHQNRQQHRKLGVQDCDYIFGDFRYDPQIGLFICYKAGRDELASVKHLEIGAYENPLTRKLRKRILSRELYDTLFNQIVFLGGNLKIYQQDLTIQSIEKVYADLPASFPE